MKKALKLAQKAQDLDEVPVGALIVQDGKIIGRGYNRRQTRQNPLEHAELMAIAQASRKLKSWRLENCTLYVTLEPCPMCAGAVIQSRVSRVVFGAYDAKGGAVCSVDSLFDLQGWNHHPEWTGGILQDICASVLKEFFRKKRFLHKQEKRMKTQAVQAAADTEDKNREGDHD